MRIEAFGVNHRTAPVQVREKLAFEEASLGRVAARLREHTGAPEVVLLSTCNRVEVYVAADDDVEPRLLDFFLKERGLRPALYRHADSEAVRHLFRVASGLDSMVVGETQILGQVKRAYLAAKDAGCTGKYLNKLFQCALYVAKSVHSNSSPGLYSVSVSSIAAGLAEKIFRSLAETTLLVVGAGETGQFTLDAFRERGVRRFLVANRTPERAAELARSLGGAALPLDALADHLHEADIVVTCITHDGPVITRGHAEAASRRRRGAPMFFIDIAVPRNVDPAVDLLEDVYLYNIDDLESIAAENLRRREKQVARCEAIVEQEARKFIAGAAMFDVQDVMVKLRSLFDSVAQQELAGLKDLSPEQRQEVERAVRRIVAKLLHRPLASLQNGSESQVAADFIRRLFDLK